MNTSKKVSLLVMVLAWFTCVAPSFARDDGRTSFGGQESSKGDHERNRDDGRGGGDEHGRKAGCENTDSDDRDRDRDRDKDRDRAKHGDDDDCQCEQAPLTEIELGPPAVSVPRSYKLVS